RARSDFIQDILCSFQAFVNEKKLKEASSVWENHLDSFYDITDPYFHVTRHDEIYKWIQDNTRGDGGGGGKASSQQPTKVLGKKCVVRSWIALDDEDLVNVEGRVSQDAMKHAVQTKSSVGLTLLDVDVGVQLVKKQMQEFHVISS
ncbi:hypothetical protein ACHAXR_000016, partial [Thalassiosira sp. AJA248-18]